MGGSSVCGVNLQCDKGKGKAEQLLRTAEPSVNCYVKALKSGSTERAGLHPTVPAYEEQLFSGTPEVAGQFKQTVFRLSVPLYGYFRSELEPFCHSVMQLPSSSC